MQILSKPSLSYAHPAAAVPLAEAVSAVSIAEVAQLPMAILEEPSPSLVVRVVMVNAAEFQCEWNGDSETILATTTLAELRMKIALKSSVPPQRQRLIFQGKMLSDDDASLATLGISHGQCIHLCPRPEVIAVAEEDTSSTEGNSHLMDRNFWGQVFRMDSLRADQFEAVLQAPSLDESESLLRLANSAKLVAAILLFYFTVVLTFMVAILFKSKEVEEENMNEDDAVPLFPPALVATLKILQPIAAVYGLMVAYTGLKGIVTFNLILTRRFYYGLIGLAVVQLILNVECEADLRDQSVIIGTVLNEAISLVFWGFCLQTVRKFLIALEAMNAPSNTPVQSGPIANAPSIS